MQEGSTMSSIPGNLCPYADGKMVICILHILWTVDHFC